jgi:hypothetical protein
VQHHIPRETAKRLMNTLPGHAFGEATMVPSETRALPPFLREIALRTEKMNT